MSNVKIEKGVPLSEHYLAVYDKHKNMSKKKGKPSPYPFRQMEVDDSFLVPPQKETIKFRMIANAWSHRLGCRFIVLKDDNHQWRCYRVA